jgi:hypothetical protein
LHATLTSYPIWGIVAQSCFKGFQVKTPVGHVP